MVISSVADFRCLLLKSQRNSQKMTVNYQVLQLLCWLIDYEYSKILAPSHTHTHTHTHTLWVYWWVRLGMNYDVIRKEKIIWKINFPCIIIEMASSEWIYYHTDYLAFCCIAMNVTNYTNTDACEIIKTQ